jgi:23S rRNA pseudouridine1911/1915/1917 synthase
LNKIYQFVPSDREAGQRLDLFLANQDIPLSRVQIQRLIKIGMVTVNQSLAKARHKLKGGDQIEVIIPPPTVSRIRAEYIPLNIVYEDDSLIVINKPWGMVVHPAAGNYTGTLVNALLFYCKDLSGIGGQERPGIVHRLDKDTSGLLVVAKDDYTHQNLGKQWQRRTIKREYIALVKGEVVRDQGEIDIPIGRHPLHRKKMWPDRVKGRPAITLYQVQERFTGFTCLKITIKTGRTHQVRVHMAYLKHPIVGDLVYGSKLERKSYSPELQERINGLKGQALHAVTLGFNHPKKGEYMEFHAPLPEAFQELVTVLSREKPS